MTSQTGQQIITIHLLPRISRSKGNQTLKFGQLKKFNAELFFFRNYVKNKAGTLVSDLLLFFKKALYKIKASGQCHDFNILW